MRELMALPINEITFEDVQAFCAHQTPENIRLDYKRGWSSPEPAKKIAKEAAAFANTQGGTILYGVEEDEKKARVPMKSPQGADLGPNPRQTIQSACAHNVFPPILPEVSDFIRNPTDRDKGFLVVRVGASEDIHTVEGGTGIYIRVNDQSEPQPATLDRIEWMLQRRGRAASLQADRRARTVNVLRGVLGSQSGPGDIEVSIGPKIIVDPLMDLASLRKNAAQYSVESLLFGGERIPINPRWRVRAMADAVYCASEVTRGLGDWAGAVDQFGNLALVARLLFKQECGAIVRESEWKPLKRDGDKVHMVEAGFAVERLLCVTRAACSLYSAMGFVGLCELDFNAPLISEYPLTQKELRGYSILGVCAPGAEVRVQSTISTMELALDPVVGLDSFAAQVLWSWGCMDSDAPNAVIDRAEQYHYGSSRCSCGYYYHANNRDKCLRCRSK